jgi:hypothetical protein
MVYVPTGVPFGIAHGALAVDVVPSALGRTVPGGVEQI